MHTKRENSFNEPVREEWFYMLPPIEVSKINLQK